MSLITPLHDNTQGGPAKAFQCGQCHAVTRTQVGMIRHLWRVHGIRQQRALPLPAEPPTLDELAATSKLEARG